jgi:hypothetical protein
LQNRVKSRFRRNFNGDHQIYDDRLCKSQFQSFEEPEESIELNPPAAALTQARKSPARFPARAHFVSFNLPNSLIWRLVSSIREPSKRRTESLAAEMAAKGNLHNVRHGMFSWIPIARSNIIQAESCRFQMPEHHECRGREVALTQ